MTKFDNVTGRQREFLLMETAMRIQELYDEASFACTINPDKDYLIDQIARLTMFCGWSEEFLKKYYGTDEYEDFFLDLMDEFMENKLNRFYR